MNPVLVLCYPYFSIFVATSIELVFVITSRTQYIVYQARPSLARKTEGFLEGGRWSGSRVNHMPGQLHSHVSGGWSSLMVLFNLRFASCVPKLLVDDYVHV